MNQFDLIGKVAIVTGGVGGLGCAISLTLADAGADVVIADLKEEEGNKMVDQIKKKRHKSLYFKIDVTSSKDVNEMCVQVVKEFGSLDIIVNCAGVCLPGISLLECDEKSWDIVIDTNLKGTFLCSQAVAKKMVERKQGSIINIASEVGIAPIRDVGSYCASKAGVIMLTQQLAMELGEYNIRVNAIAPGMVPTDINAPLWDTPEKVKGIAESLVLGRLGKTSDIGDAVVFLASDKSSFITGHTMVVNGGGSIVPSRV